MRPHAPTPVWLAIVPLLAGCAAATLDTHATPNPASSTAARGAALSACPPASGSDLPATPTDACMAMRRSYSATDVSRTGQTQAGRALSMMDPSVTVSR